MNRSALLTAIAMLLGSGCDGVVEDATSIGTALSERDACEGDKCTQAPCGELARRCCPPGHPFRQELGGPCAAGLRCASDPGRCVLLFSGAPSDSASPASFSDDPASDCALAPGSDPGPDTDPQSTSVTDDARTPLPCGELGLGCCPRGSVYVQELGGVCGYGLTCSAASTCVSIFADAASDAP